MKHPVSDRAKAIDKARANLTVTEEREHNHLRKRQSREWRIFWIKVMKRQGATNVQIARDLEISESTVRYLLKTTS